MKFVETLKLKSKLFLLLIFIMLGIGTVGIMGALHVEAMKKNMDSLYFGSLVPVVELNEILQTYHGELTTTIYKAKNKELSNEHIKLEIKNDIQKVSRLWNSYKSHYKRDEELEYIGYVSNEIKNTNLYFKKIIYLLDRNVDISKISIEVYEKNIAHIHKILHRLIAYEIDVAKVERKNFLNRYNKIMHRLGIMLVLILFGVFIVSFWVFKNIQKNQNELEKTSIKLKKLNKKLENASYTDSLTGLYNRRYFNLIYDRELKRAKRARSFITFMMVDIDYFKQYNDTYGHIEGDFALKSVAKVLKDTLKRPSDFVFRLGGEEFGVLFSNTNESDSARIAQKICDALLAREIKHQKSEICDYLTVSVGVACCVADSSLDDELLISKADEMLYRSKNGGRNRYSISSSIVEASELKVS